MSDFSILSLNDNDMPNSPIIQNNYFETIEDLFIHLYNENSNISFVALQQKLIEYYNNETSETFLKSHFSDCSNILNDSEYSYILDEISCYDDEPEFNLKFLTKFITTPMGVGHLNWIYERQCL
jgi:hypothetical protein